MKAFLRKLWQDDGGFIISVEMLFICCILVIGLVGGMTALRHGITTEYAAVGNAVATLNEGYSVVGEQSASGASGDTTVTHTQVTVSVTTNQPGAAVPPSTNNSGTSTGGTTTGNGPPSSP